MSLKNGFQDQEIKEIKTHIAKTNEEIGFIWREIVSIKTSLEWLVKTYWLIAGAAVGSLIVAVLNLVLKSK